MDGTFSTGAGRYALPPARRAARADHCRFRTATNRKDHNCRQALSRIDLESRYLAVDEPETDEFRFGARRIPSDTAETTFRLPQARRDAEWLVHNWEAARREAERFGRGFVLVFDEIQKIDRWSETVKGLWDADRASGCLLHVVILGSAPLLTQTGLNESLAGRFEPLHVTHWSFDEMAAAFDFDLPSYMYFGSYPGAARFVREPRRWRGYILGALVEPNIECDIVAMTRVDKPALLKCSSSWAPPIPAKSSRTPKCSANFRIVATRLPWHAILTCSPKPAC